MDRTNVKQQVKEFFGSRRHVYATPSGANYTSNFYGDTPLCKLTRTNVLDAILTIIADWEGYSEQEAIDEVLGDMQYEKPTSGELGF